LPLASFRFKQPRSILAIYPLRNHESLHHDVYPYSEPSLILADIPDLQTFLTRIGRDAVKECEDKIKVITLRGKLLMIDMARVICRRRKAIETKGNCTSFKTVHIASDREVSVCPSMMGLTIEMERRLLRFDGDGRLAVVSEERTRELRRRRWDDCRVVL
jgi:hypothetical protein